MRASPDAGGGTGCADFADVFADFDESDSDRPPISRRNRAMSPSLGSSCRWPGPRGAPRSVGEVRPSRCVRPAREEGITAVVLSVRDPQRRARARMILQVELGKHGKLPVLLLG